MELAAHIVIQAFREYMDSNAQNVPEVLGKLFSTVNSTPIPSERGFFKMNLISEVTACIPSQPHHLYSDVSSKFYPFVPMDA